jgi:hypothetical protein
MMDWRRDVLGNNPQELNCDHCGSGVTTESREHGDEEPDSVKGVKDGGESIFIQRIANTRTAWKS